LQDSDGKFFVVGQFDIQLVGHRKRQRRDNMSEEKKDKAPVDLTHPSIGGKKVGHPIPIRTNDENPFEHLGGKVVLKPSDHPLFNAKPEESVEKQGTGGK
jgi:hypothetical protein